PVQELTSGGRERYYDSRSWEQECPCSQLPHQARGGPTRKSWGATHKKRCPDSPVCRLRGVTGTDLTLTQKKQRAPRSGSTPAVNFGGCREKPTTPPEKLSVLPLVLSNRSSARWTRRSELTSTALIRTRRLSSAVPYSRRSFCAQAPQIGGGAGKDLRRASSGATAGKLPGELKWVAGRQQSLQDPGGGVQLPSGIQAGRDTLQP
ncbi:hypothetical protein CSUI_009288, partial [Cystoisospora suis]